MKKKFASGNIVLQNGRTKEKELIKELSIELDLRIKFKSTCVLLVDFDGTLFSYEKFEGVRSGGFSYQNPEIRPLASFLLRSLYERNVEV